MIKKIRELQAALIALRATLLMTQFATGASVGGGALAGLLAFILNPEIWIPVAIAAVVVVLTAGLAFIIKKFFPNVWNTIAVWWIKFKYGWIQLMADIMETPAMQLLSKIINREKVGFGKEVFQKQSDWAQKYPNHQFVFNVGGYLDALNMNAYNKAMNLTPLTRGINTARQIAPAVKYLIEQKYKIDVRVDGVEDKKTIMDSVHSAIGEFAEKQKKHSALSIINSKINNRNTLTPLSSGIF